jgi:tetratricopeptide (TPR) repeat protein
MQTNSKAALAILKLNVEMYPASFNVYDSYGEALANSGQKDLAIENYKKSVELNPGNANGLRALEALGVKMEAKAVDIPEATLQTYVGTYQLAPNFNIVFTREGKQMYTQATGQPRFEIYPASEREFYLKVVVARVVFNLNAEGAVESITLFQNGQEVKGKKIE